MNPSPRRNWKLAIFFTPLCVIGCSCLLAALYFYTNIAAKDGWNDLIANLFLAIAVGSLIIDGLLKFVFRKLPRLVWILELIVVALAFALLYLYNKGMIGI